MNTTENKDNFVKTLLSFSIGPIVNIFIGFISVLTTTWFLFPQELGKAAMYTTSIEIISSVVFLGQLRAHAREYNNETNKSHLLYNILIIPLILSIFVTIAGIIFRNEISIFLFGEYSILSMVLFSITLPIKVIERFAASIIRMEGKGKLYSFHQILQKIVSFSILLGFFLLISPTYHAVIMASIGSLFVNSISQIYFMRKMWKNMFKQQLDLDLIKKMLRFGIPLVPVAGLMWVFNSADKLMIRYFSDFNQLGFYSGAFKIIALLNVIKKSFVDFWSPTSYKWYKSGESIKKFQKVSNYLMSLFMLLTSNMIIFKDIIFKLLSAKYIPSADVFPFLMFIPMMTTMSEATMVGIQFKRKTHYQIYAAIIVAIFNIVGNFLLVPRFGAIGASISTGFSYILFFYIRTYLSNKVWENIKLTHYTINIFLLIIMASLSILKTRILFAEIIIYIIIIFFNLTILRDILSIAIKTIKKRGTK